MQHAPGHPKEERKGRVVERERLTGMPHGADSSRHIAVGDVSSSVAIGITQRRCAQAKGEC
jgi:hypothetical protein